MNTIVGIGANVCDTLLTIPQFPDEDTKMRASAAVQSGGGPCATGLVAAAKLGESCAYIGNLTDDSAGSFLKADLEKWGVSTAFTEVKSGYTSFTSTIWLSEQSASRTCVFYRGNVPPTVLSDRQKEAIADAEILMVDGNDLSAGVEGSKIARQNGTKVLYDAGGLYDGIEELLRLTDILIPSEAFALCHTGCSKAEDAAKILFQKYAPEVVVITQGQKGGILYDGNTLEAYPAFAVHAVDSNGSGDVFHGAFAFCAAMGYNYKKSCIFSSAVSALKCTKVGARLGVPTFDETIEFLKERGVCV
ncbi:MAG: carbohydrate kinase family protein [Clostridia bacterium]